MFTKRLWQAVVGYDEAITFGEDSDLCVRFILEGRIPVHVPVTTHFHRNHTKSLAACYLDKSVCLVWLAEHRARYRKHAHALTYHLSEDELGEVRRVLQISPDTLLNAPPSRDMAAALSVGPRLRGALSGPRSTRPASP